jgi:spermidine/putrescine transport system permease protein
VLLILVIVPFWTSILIRSYAWIYLLGGQGIPSLLNALGLGNPRLINTPFAVLVGIVYGYLPLMVFPIYVALERLDKRLLEASSDLGSPPWRSFLQVTLPLSMPGVATGCMLVFILLMGEFLIPAMLGGGKVFFIGNALGRPVPAIAQLGLRLGGGGGAGACHAGHRGRLHALYPALGGRA